MEIRDNVYVFAFDTTYFGNDRTWHPVGVETDRGLVLIDTGGPDDEDLLEEAMGEHGFGFGDIDKILMTHHDYDHLGCLVEVVEESNAEVLAHRYETPYVMADTPMVMRPEEPYEGTPVHLQLTNGEVFCTNAGDVEAIYTPGHSPGHLVYYFQDEQLLVAGDLLRSDSEYLSGPKKKVTPDLATSRESIGKLTSLDVESIVCFHGGPIEATEADIRRVHDVLTEEVSVPHKAG